MEQRTNGSWVIFLSFFVAYLLAIVPFPDWAMNYRPQWVAMVLIYWAMALPYRVGIGFAWVAGLLMDILEGSLLGLNALALAIIAYITLSLHQRLRMFSSVQQSALVLALIGLHLMMTHWMKIAAEQAVSSDLLFLLGALSSAFVWPWMFVLLRQMRRGFSVR
ncbi:MAG: rod shape-determining protein MreD [Pseudohongiellaceae bacterium]|nr:MAG: rod shape-determining protein MreD [Gammaproteobacteria bacterium RIFCSPLOWO2_02_FULL_57_10]